MKVKLSSPEEAIAVVKRIVFLAYNAAGGAIGMGIFQSGRAGSFPDEESVWKCAYNSEDYGGIRHTAENEIYCDYVFGSMMKWGCKWEDCEISIPEKIFRPDYQGFTRTYKDNMTLVTAALKSLEIKKFEIE